MSSKVLIVDDDPNVLSGFRRHMRNRLTIHAVCNGKEALEALEGEGPFAVIVADMRMPGMSGVQLLGEFVRRAPDTSRIMLTGCGEQETAKEAVNEGNIFRFLTKPCPPETLVKVIEEAIEEHIRIVQEREHVIELQESAFTDELTGVGNRRHFLELARHEIRRARRSGKPLSAVMLDADFFKKVNDNFGHQVGDEVLRMLARICEESLRESDVLGRYGGEEFAILFPETDVIKAKDVAERIRKAVAAEVVETEDGPVRITVSMGVASGMGKDVGIDAILERADAALYVAKENGRDRVEMDRDSLLDSRKEAQ